MRGERRGQDDTTLVGASDTYQGPRAAAASTTLALVLVWSRDEPERVGELLRPPPGSAGTRFSIGRASRADDEGVEPLTLCRLRPSSVEDTGPFGAGRVSRRQLYLELDDAGRARLTNASRRTALRINGTQVPGARLSHGDLIEVERRFSLLVAARPSSWPNEQTRGRAFSFGGPDEHGLVGESPAAWSTRRELAFLSERDEHVLVHGPSGCGKELIVRGLHNRSRRREAKLVARNAATFPETLLDAELFGNTKNFPNPGMPERPGLLGRANRSTLFLDEIGELPEAMQAHLLRVMDHGEYQRLGEATTRRSDARIIGATNRPLSHLKHDVLARFTHRVEAPGLSARRDDIPLLVRHILRDATASDPALAERFLDDGAEPRLSAGFIHWVITRPYTTHVRELAGLIWRSIRASRGARLEPVGPLSMTNAAADAAPPPEVDIRDLSRADIVAALKRCRGVQERAWRELGLRNRYQLKRLIRKHDIEL